MDFENVLQIIVTAIIQGVTEFLPVSSSGHTLFVNNIFFWKDAINLNLFVAVHFGTLAAVIKYFWSDIKKSQATNLRERNKFRRKKIYKKI